MGCLESSADDESDTRDVEMMSYISRGDFTQIEAILASAPYMAHKPLNG